MIVKTRGYIVWGESLGERRGLQKAFAFTIVLRRS